MLTVTTHQWAEEEFGNCDLGDQRRTRRTVQLASDVAQNPSAGFPDICESWTDLKAAYDLFDNDAVTFQNITAAHREKTCDLPPGRYLVIGDTTDVDFGWHREIEGTYPTGNGGGNGFLLHSALVVNPQNHELLGLAGQTIHYRKPQRKQKNDSQGLRRKRESQVWGQVIDQVGPPPEAVEWVHVFDRGADNFEVFCHLLQQRSQWVIRCTHKTRKIITPADEKVSLREYLDELDEAGRYELEVYARDGQAARTAQVRVRHGKLWMPTPSHKSPYVKQVAPDPIAMWVIVVEETGAPAGVEPLHWILYSSLPVDSFEDAWTVIGYYEQRPLIEEWHKALKTGCRLTDRQLKTSKRLEVMTGLFSVVSVRLVQLKSMAQTDSTRKAQGVVPPLWLELLARVRKVRSKSQMTIRDFYRELAKLGGFLGRKHDGEPGWITVWRGWEKLNLMVRGAKAANGFTIKNGRKCR